MYTLCKHAARTVRKVCIIKEFTLGIPVGEKTVVLDEKHEKGARPSQDTSVRDITSDNNCNRRRTRLLEEVRLLAQLLLHLGAGAIFSIANRGLVTICHSEEWTEEAGAHPPP